MGWDVEVALDQSDALARAQPLPRDRLSGAHNSDDGHQNGDTEGEEQDLKIRAVANRDREILLAEADRTSNQRRGEGEAEAISILAEALNQDPDFFAFRHSLEAYQTFLNQQTTVILSSEADLFQFLQSPQKKASAGNNP